MQKSVKYLLCVIILSVCALFEAQAQSITYEVRNCTGETWCVTAIPHSPVPPGCSPGLEVCFGSTLLGPNSTMTRTIDTQCYYLNVSMQPSNTPRITSFDPSGPYGNYCACWDYSGVNPVLTIYEGDCSTPCPAPACP